MTDRNVTGIWEDLRFPSQGINPIGAASDPTPDTNLSNFPGTLLFSGSAQNIIGGIAQMPHAWMAGTAVRPHIHWSKPIGSSSAVTWEFYYRIVGNPGDTATAWVGPLAGTLVIGDPSVTDRHCITRFPEITLNGYQESCIIAWRIDRRGDTDADNNQARLLEFDIHFRANKRGTVKEIPGT
jgi:hypothetical protein